MGWNTIQSKGVLGMAELPSSPKAEDRHKGNPIGAALGLIPFPVKKNQRLNRTKGKELNE